VRLGVACDMFVSHGSCQVSLSGSRFCRLELGVVPVMRFHQTIVEVTREACLLSALLGRAAGWPSIASYHTDHCNACLLSPSILSMHL